MLADCSHSSAVAVGQRCRLAFRKNGLHAFGGYIEGFLPAKFDVEAVASDDRILAFLQLADALPTLEAGKERFTLSRGGVEVRFEAAADVPLPKFPSFRAPKFITGVDLKSMEALVECVPKTGWGALNTDMLGIIATDIGMVSTDNSCLAWAPEGNFTDKVILPRPFCLALMHWADELGNEFKLTHSPVGIMAEWTTGAKLYGSLPASAGTSMDLSALCEEMKVVTYQERLAEVKSYLDEAAIFSEDLIITVQQGGLYFSTPGEISWHRSMEFTSEKDASFAVPLKRLRTALNYTDEWAIGDNRIYLRTQAQDLYIVIAAKGGPA